MTTIETPWRGYHRPKGARRWVKVLSAATEDEAWSALLAMVLTGDRAVCPANRDPNSRPFAAGGRRRPVDAKPRTPPMTAR